MMTMVNRNHPDFWLLPIYIEYGLIAVMLGCYVCLPETPWYYGRRENREGCFKSMRRLYGNVEGYDYEEEYGIILRTIAHEKELLAEAKTQSWTQVFRGLNGVSQLPSMVEWGLIGAETNVYPARHVHRSASRR